MLFNSLEFLLFGIIFFSLWPIFRRHNNGRWLLLSISRIIFYGWWDWRFVFLLIFSGTTDFFIGLRLGNQSRNKKLLLVSSLLINLGSLAIFKYSEFLATVIQDIISITLGFNLDLVNTIPEFSIILPVGISFYTFQSMSYTIDVYRFFSYLSMFPQLVAGPIVRAGELLNQLKSFRIPNAFEKWNAFKIIVYGFFQKVVLADNLSLLVDSAFQNKTSYDNILYWWAVTVAFSFQIYFDFSGYSLIARGLAKLMGYHFKMNFNHPYHAKGFQQFWRKWHISLSSWFRDYVYIPLGGSRTGFGKSILALLITFLLSGLWHGANYTFIVWALLHWLLLVLGRLAFPIPKQWIPEPILILVTFIITNITWVFFRANNIEQAIEITLKLFTKGQIDFNFFKEYLNNIVFLLLGIIIEIGIYTMRKVSAMRELYKKNNLDLISLTICILLIMFFRGEGQQFIYFQF